MLIDRFSPRCQEALERASRLAVKKGHRHVTPWHLLAALLTPEHGARALFTAAGADVALLQRKVETQLLATPRADAGADTTPISRALEAVFVRADDLAGSRSQPRIEVGHLVAALAESREVMTALEEVGVGGDQLATALTATPTAAAGDTVGGDDGSVLMRYTRDLTAAARRGELDPLIGRDLELKLTIEVLSRRGKNNPILVGEAGVGKTAIVEGLAQRIVDGRVPIDLQRMRLVALDLGQLLAGARYRGEFEERLQALLREVHEARDVIVFIDEIHLVVGAGGADGSMDAANLLKPALARGELRCLGATTPAEYRKRIEKDPALTRRFQVVTVAEPTVAESVAMLRGLKPKYERHHGVRILDEAIVGAVRLSRRYLADRCLPDKAIDLLDQTAAAVRLSLAARPAGLEALEARVSALELQCQSLAGETALEEHQALADLQVQLSQLRRERDEARATWTREREALETVRAAERELAAARAEKPACIAAGSFARVAELDYKIIPDCEARLAAHAGVSPADRDETVREEHIAATVARVTGIPTANLLAPERERLLQLESHLRRRVVGQDEALHKVAQAVRRARAGVQSPTRPIASFLLLGPTGVGKTELAKALAELLFDDERALVRIDMSELMERHSTARLIGAPPGYVGYEEGGLLTNQVRRRPYAVILFDEVEKAHPDVFHLFLQLLDEGRLTDSHGQTVDFTNTIVLMTSNLGAEHMLSDEAAAAPDEVVQAVMTAVRARFRPELLNRLDDIVLFQPLGPVVMAPIVDIQLGRLRARLGERRIELQVADGARARLAETGYHPTYGARPLQRAIQSQLSDPLAQKIIEGAIADGHTVHVDVRDGVLDIVGTATARGVS